MLLDKDNVHRLLVVAAERTKSLQRRISLFRTTKGILINLFVYDEGEKPSVLLQITRGNYLSDLMVEESYRLYADGSCNTNVVANIKSMIGFAIHRTEESKTYTMEQALARYPHDGWTWLKDQLDVLADWLSNKETVRVDPYHPERVLGDEDTDVDRSLASNVTLVDEFRKKLRKTPLTPGIHVIE